MRDLNKVETAAALAAVKAVINSGPGVNKEHPLNTAATKLEDNLKEFNDTFR